MDRILTLLLAFLIVLAPAAPREAGPNHGHAAAHGGSAHADAHRHAAVPHIDAGVQIPAAECSFAGGHCIAALAAPIRVAFEVNFKSVSRPAVRGFRSGRGIVLTAEPPPPRA